MKCFIILPGGDIHRALEYFFNIIIVVMYQKLAGEAGEFGLRVEKYSLG